MSVPSITHIETLDVRCAARAWPWAEANSRAIDAYWKAATERQPKLFDGPVFMFADVQVEGSTLRAVCFETGFSRLLYAKAKGFPDPLIVNGFAMAALCAADGAFLLGVMGDETANAGQIYFPSGTPDPSDRQRGGALDLMGSVVRELAEETGLQAGDYEVGHGWTLVRDGGFLALCRLIRLADKANEARSRILQSIRHLKEQELSDIRIVRGPSDIDGSTMPRFVQAYLRWSFAGKFK